MTVNGGMLAPYRVLDLADEKGLFCGKLLSDLGADVIKIERPQGDPAREIGPFVDDVPGPERSLFWFAFNTGKRSVTLDIEQAEDRQVLIRLIKTADFLVESFPPGYMESLGLGYEALEAINPGLIMVSISPFGQTGPYRDYKPADIVSWAMGGYMFPWTNVDHPPLRISHHPQACLHAAGEGAAGALLALHHRHLTGKGQLVDVSIHESIVEAAYILFVSWDFNRVPWDRGTQGQQKPALPQMWPCQDGYVMVMLIGGGRGNERNRPLVNWMDENGMADDFLLGLDWETVDMQTITTETASAIEQPIRRFFLTQTKAELLQEALARGVILYPIQNTADIMASLQLEARGFWSKIEHEELGKTITYPGAFAVTSEAPPQVRRRAPLVGEHNREILEDELKNPRNMPHSPENGGMRAPSTADGGLLSGLRVADFSWVIAGPLTAKRLADHGAEVIKIEGRARPDLHRTVYPFKDDIVSLDRAGRFHPYNTSKLSVTLDLSTPRGVETAKLIVANCDIVIENFAGGVMEKMGLGYEALKKVKPDIIMLSSSMMGQTGPYAHSRGYGWQLTAMAGFFSITGWPQQPPIGPNGPYTDYIAPRINIVLLMAALDYRRRTGKGQYLDVSQYENGVQFIAPLVLDYVVNGRIAGPMGNRHPEAAPHGAYRCQGEDRWCVIAVFNEDEWSSFRRVIGNPAWADDARFASLESRKQNEDELDRKVEAWCLERTPEEVMTSLQSVGVAAGVVQVTGEDILDNDPQLKHRGYIWELDHPELGKHRVPGLPFKLSKSPYRVKRSPLLGEHSKYVLNEVAGLTDDEIASLVIEGVNE